MPIAGYSIPVNVDILELASAVAEILRRGVDGTVVPLFVDSINQRVIIGNTQASASPASLEIHNGDAKVVTAGSGLILSNRSGTKFYRVIMEDDGAIAADPL